MTEELSERLKGLSIGKLQEEFLSEVDRRRTPEEQAAAYPYPRLVSPAVEGDLQRLFAQPGVRVFFNDKDWPPEPVKLTRRSRFKLTRRSRFRLWRVEWWWRLSRAWRHLRGIECYGDD